MKHDYEGALNELKGYGYDLPDDLYDTVLNALKLAAKLEQWHPSVLRSAIDYMQNEKGETAVDFFKAEQSQATILLYANAFCELLEQTKREIE